MEMAPENCPTYADEPKCTGVKTCTEGCSVTAEGAFWSKGVLANVMDPWVGVVPASVGSAVDGEIEAGHPHYTDCGHDNSAPKP